MTFCALVNTPFPPQLEKIRQQVDSSFSHLFFIPLLPVRLSFLKHMLGFLRPVHVSPLPFPNAISFVNPKFSSPPSLSERSRLFCLHPPLSYPLLRSEVAPAIAELNYSLCASNTFPLPPPCVHSSSDLRSLFQGSSLNHTSFPISLNLS